MKRNIIRITPTILNFVQVVQWLMYLVQFVVTRINCMHMRQNYGWYSPIEMFTGIKLNYKRDCHICFGEYIQAFKPLQIINTMHKKTDGDTSLLSTGRISESVRLMCLRTFKPIVRTQWTVLPISQIFVRFINKLVNVDENNSHIGQEPAFT